MLYQAKSGNAAANQEPIPKVVELFSRVSALNIFSHNLENFSRFYCFAFTQYIAAAGTMAPIRR
jgi:hypothetical protein